MLPSHDIFKTYSDGSVLWRGAVESVEAAKARIQTLALSSPGEYLILNQSTGDRIRVASAGSVKMRAAGDLRNCG